MNSTRRRDDAGARDERRPGGRRPMTEQELDDLLSAPRAETVAALLRSPGDIVVLGAGGKMGPTLARMAARAAAAADAEDAGSGSVPRPRSARRVFAVSRFSSAAAAAALDGQGVRTIRCDLLDREAVAKLPDAPNVIFMAGQKFGTSDAPATTWAMNTIVPAICAERYREAAIVAFSTGNVYPLVPTTSGGARETDTPAPLGEYAASALGRERVLEFTSARHGTRVAIVRLNYAIDLRYGVLADIAQRVRDGTPVSLAMGSVNVIWQGDANRIAIECLARATAPPFVVNVTGAEVLSVRELAERFGARFGRAPRFEGREGTDALLSDTTRMRTSFAAPAVSIDAMIDMVAAWITAGGASLGKPTHFEERTGRF